MKQEVLYVDTPQRYVEKLAQLGWRGSVKFVFTDGVCTQAVQSTSQAGAGCVRLVDTEAATDLLTAARLSSLTGYVVIYLDDDGVGATYVKTGAADDSMTWERAWQQARKEGARWIVYSQKQVTAAM